MNKVVFFLFFILLSLSYLFDVDRLIISNFNFVNSFKNFYYKQAIKTNDFLEEYFLQASNIKKYKLQNQELKQYKNLYKENSALYERLLNESLITNKQEKFDLVKVLSYVNFNDFTKVWLDKKKSSDKILALIDDEYAAGIVIKYDDKSLALLNGNEKSNYAVYIGKNSAPGIVHKNEDNGAFLKIKYIPIWINIALNDEVITSGMDNIFYKGLKVGKVIKIIKMADMQEAIIAPYSKVHKKRFFYTYEKLEKKEKVQPNKKP